MHQNKRSINQILLVISVTMKYLLMKIRYSETAYDFLKSITHELFDSAWECHLGLKSNYYYLEMQLIKMAILHLIPPTI
jgi:hypothetical protein